MKSAVVVLPGLNRDRDMIAALTKIGGKAPATVWHNDTDIPEVDLIVIPGGFSYGDYLRCGAIAARLPIMQAVAERAAKGVQVLGVCNGFQILFEAGLLPGALMRNTSLKFVCREVKLEVANANTAFTSGYAQGQVIRCPVAHHDGNYFADAETLARLEGNGQVVFRYAEGTNPNGSLNDIAGIFNATERARPDAAPRKPDRGRPWRHRRPRAVRERARPARRVSASHGAFDPQARSSNAVPYRRFETQVADADASPSLPLAASPPARCLPVRRNRPGRGGGKSASLRRWSRWRSPRTNAGSPARTRPSALPHGQRAEFLQRAAAFPAGSGEELRGPPLLVVQAEGRRPTCRRSGR